MSTAGLARKFGLKPGMTALLYKAPESFAASLQASGEGLELVTASRKPVACVIAFVSNKADVASAVRAALAGVVADGLLWFAYPKKTGALKSDLSRDSGWEPVYAAGLDSVAQISIDDTWTGFRFRARHLVGKAR